MTINFGILDPNTARDAALSFQAGQQNRLAQEQAQQQQEMNALRLNREKQAMADENALRDIYAQSGGDVNKVVAGMKQAGMYEPAMKMEGMISEQQMAQKKAQIEEAKQHFEIMGRLAGSVTDQASYDIARAQMAQIYGPELASKIPPQYDPQAVKSFQMQALSAKDQLDLQMRQMDAQLKERQFGFEQKKFGAQQSLEREKMQKQQSQFAQAQALEREKLGTKAQGTQAMAKEQAQAKIHLPQIEASVEIALKNVDELLAHPGFKTSVGAGLGHATKFIPGTDAADFNARLDQLQGGAFLQAFNSLKGGGQITEVEGRKATQAITRMSTAQSEKEFKAAAEEFKQVLRTGLKNARKGAGQDASSTDDGWSDL